MNKFLFFVFVFTFSLFGMNEDSSKTFIEKLNNTRYFYPLSAGLLTSVSLYGLLKTNFPLLKNMKNLSTIKKFLLFSGSGITAGGLFLIFKKNDTGLIMRPDYLDFWLTDRDAQEYLALRKKANIDIEEKENLDIMEIIGDIEEKEDSVLTNYISNVMVAINKKYWPESEKSFESLEQAKNQQTNNFLSSCDIKNCKKYKVRIFNETISFANLVEFIKNVDREELLYFLRWKSTIRYNLQGELISEVAWDEVEAEQLAAFLAFGYYADTCGKFLYLKPDMLMTFLENAVYYMYYKDCGKRSEENIYFKKITKLFEKYCRLKITNVEFKETGKEAIKKHPVNIMIEKIKEE
jgi:hypothetical protein